MTRNRSSRRPRNDVGLDREHDDDADDDRLQERVDVQQVHAVADHADHQRADEGVRTVPRPPRKLAPPMMTAAIESSSARLPDVGEPALSRPDVMIAGDAGQQAAQHVHRDQHRLHRDARAPSGLRVAADRVDPATPHEACQHHRDDERRRRATRNAEYGNQPIDPPPIVRTIGGMPRIGWPPDEPQRQAAGDAQRGEGDDERVGQAAPHVDAAVDEADRGARRPASRGSRPHPRRRVR